MGPNGIPVVKKKQKYQISQIDGYRVGPEEDRNRTRRIPPPTRHVSSRYGDDVAIPAFQAGVDGRRGFEPPPPAFRMGHRRSVIPPSPTLNDRYSPSQVSGCHTGPPSTTTTPTQSTQVPPPRPDKQTPACIFKGYVFGLAHNSVGWFFKHSLIAFQF